MLIATGIHMRLHSSNTLFNHVSDCSVSCANGTRSPQTIVTVVQQSCHNTMTENANVKLTMMVPPLQCMTGTN